MGDDVAEDERELEDAAGGDARRVRKLIDPRLPSEAEVLEHYLTHVPYRNWCPHCVRGRGKEMCHTRCEEKERGLDEFHLGYCFPGMSLALN